ncbi:MAG: transcriptional regulator [Clostridiales bacterium 43-6]|nr:MAG: transcriptional regulator [Clostridiales bacterium 43-6]
MIDLKECEKRSELLKAMAHPHRLCIIKGLYENACNVTKMQDCLNIPQSTVSQHIAKLRAAGIIEGTREGNEICYRLVNEDAIQILKTLFHLK